MRALIVIVACLLLCGCAMKFGADNVAGGGGTFGFQSWRCDPSIPVGGNTGEVGNDTTDGGTVGTTHP